MERLTVSNPQNNLETALNLFFVKDGQAWVRGGGAHPDYSDVTLYDYIRAAVKHCAVSPELWEMVDDGTMGEIMADWAMEGNLSKEGLLGILYQAGWAFAELRERLKIYEDTGLTPEEISFSRTSIENPTNGDKVRELIAVPDRQLAKVLRKLDEVGDLAERISYCLNKPECQKIIDRDEYVPEDECLQCLTHWLGQPADKKLWSTVNGNV